MADWNKLDSQFYDHINNMTKEDWENWKSSRKEKIMKKSKCEVITFIFIDGYPPCFGYHKISFRDDGVWELNNNLSLITGVESSVTLIDVMDARAHRDAILMIDGISYDAFYHISDLY